MSWSFSLLQIPEQAVHSANITTQQSSGASGSSNCLLWHPNHMASISWSKGCSNSCLHIHIPAGRRKEGSGGHSLSLNPDTAHTIFIHLPLARFIFIATLTSRRLTNTVWWKGPCVQLKFRASITKEIRNS